MVTMKVVAVKKDGAGSITDYKLDDGSVISRDEAINMVESGQLEGYNVTVAKNGVKAIRTKPDDTMTNNLDNLPTF